MSSPTQVGDGRGRVLERRNGTLSIPPSARLPDVALAREIGTPEPIVEEAA
jgi:hypothetical protein